MRSVVALITFLGEAPYPDNSLPQPQPKPPWAGGPGGPGTQPPVYPSHPIYRPPYPSQGLPPFPDNSLPGQPPYPSQGLPPFPSHPIVLPPGIPQPPLGIWGPGFPYPDNTLPTPPAQPGHPVNLPSQNPDGGWVYAFVPGVGWVWAYKPSDARPDNTLPTPPVEGETPEINPL